MSDPLHADPNDRFDTSVILASRYDELTRVDQALRDAQQRLDAAHSRCVEDGPAHARELYQQIVALRDRSRLMLAQLAEIWVADP